MMCSSQEVWNSCDNFSVKMSFTDPSTVINGSSDQYSSSTLSLYNTFSYSILNDFAKIIISASQPTENYI